jgi:hypothetical protein
MHIVDSLFYFMKRAMLFNKKNLHKKDKNQHMAKF